MAAQVRISREQSATLGLFSRVLFLSTASRSHISHHVVPSFSYFNNWLSTFHDLEQRSEVMTPLHERVPSVLIGLDADTKWPSSVSPDALRTFLTESRGQGGAAADSGAQATARWQARQQGCAETPCPRGPPSRVAYVQFHKPQKSTDWMDRMAAAWSNPVRRSHGTIVHGASQKPCCNLTFYNWDVTALHAEAAITEATISRGPFCPPTSGFALHRDNLPMLLAQFRVWQRCVLAIELVPGPSRPDGGACVCGC